jgi:hypothetical protein
LQGIHLRLVAIALGLLALVFLAGGLGARSGSALGWALAALGSEYAVLFAAQGRLDEQTPLYAGAFLFVAELAFWSIERRVPASSEPGLVEWRLCYLAGVSAGAAVVAAVVLVVAASAGGGGVALESIGVAAAIGALALVAALVRRSAAEVDSA